MRITWFQFFENRSNSFIFAISITLMVLSGVLDYLTGPEFSFYVLYFLPIAIAAWYGKRWVAVLISTLSAIIWLTADLLGSHYHSRPLIPYWNAAMMLGIFLSVAYFLAALKKALNQELELAAEIQRGLLPKTIPNIRGLSISAVMRPSKTVSGDHYDLLELSDRQFAFCVSDAVGHGIPAALLMSNLQAAIRILASESISPNELAKKVNHIISNNISDGRFISFFYGLIDTDSKVLTYTNAGHHPPILLRNNGSYESLETGGTMIGVSVDLHFELGKLELRSGDRLLLYTDGVVEMKNSRKKEFGVERLIRILGKSQKCNSAELQGIILKALTKFNPGPIQDDITFLVISVN